VLAGLLALIGSAPYVVAPLWGPGIVAAIANSRIKGKLKIDKLSLSWVGAIELNGLRLEDPDGRGVLEVQSIRLDRGILKAIFSGQRFGQLDIRQPRVVLYRSAGGRYSLLDALEPRRPRQPPKEKEEPAEPAGRLALTDGTVDFIGPDGATLVSHSLNVQCHLQTLKDIRFTLAVADLASCGLPQRPAQPVRFQLNGTVSVAQDRIKGSADLRGDIGDLRVSFSYAQPPRDYPVQPGEVIDALMHGRAVALPELTLTPSGSLDVARLAAALPAVLNVRRDAHLKRFTVNFRQINIAGGAKPVLRGRIEVADVEAVVAGKTVTWDTMSADLDIRTDERNRLRIDKADVDLGRNVLQVTSRGTAADVSVHADGDLANLQDKLAGLFDVNSFVMVGAFNLDARVHRAEHEPDKAADDDAGTVRMSVELTGRADGVAFRRAGRGVNDFALTGKLEWKADIVKAASLISAEGAGDLSNLVLTLAGEEVRLTHLRLEHNVAYDRKPQCLTVTKAKVTSEALDVDATGLLEGFSAGARVKLGGTYAVDWDKLTPILRQFAEKTPATLAALKNMRGKFNVDLAANSVNAQFDFTGTLGRLALTVQAPDVKGLTAIDPKDLLEAAWWGEPLPVLPEAHVDLDGRLHLDVLTAAAPYGAIHAGRPHPSQGDLEFRKILLHAGRTPAASGTIAFTNAAVLYEGQTSYLGNVLLQVALSVDESRRWKADTLALTAPALGVKASGTAAATTLEVEANLAQVGALYGRWFGLDDTLLGACRIKGSLRRAKVTDKCLQADLAATLDRAGLLRAPDPGAPAAAKAHPTEVSGQLTYNGRIDWSEGLLAAGTLLVKDLLVQGERLRHQQQALTISHDIRADKAGDLMQVRQLQVATQPAWLWLEATGTVNKWRTERILDLRGSYAGDGEQVCALIKSFQPDAPIPDDYVFRGKIGEKFKVVGPMRNPRLMTAGAAVAWDSAKALGLDLGQAKLQLALADGMFRLPLTEVSASGGTARLAATVDLRGQQPVLQLPPGLQVLNQVHLNKEFAHKALSRANPMFAGLATIEGKASLRMNDLRVPFGATGKTDALGSGRLELTDVKFQPAGLLGQLLPLLGMGGGQERAMEVGALDFRIRGGAVEYDNFRVVIDKSFDLIFSGRVAFNDSLQMTVSLPVHEALLGKLGGSGPLRDYARLLKGARIQIPVVGARQSPGLDLRHVEIDKLIRKAAEGLLREEAGRRLRP